MFNIVTVIIISIIIISSSSSIVIVIVIIIVAQTLEPPCASDGTEHSGISKRGFSRYGGSYVLGWIFLEYVWVTGVEARCLKCLGLRTSADIEHCRLRKCTDEHMRRRVGTPRKIHNMCLYV